MPLKIVKRAGTETLYVRGTVRGQSVYESTGTSDAKRAESYRSKREAGLWDRSVYGSRAVYTFAHAVESYLSAREHTSTTKRHVSKLLAHFGTTHLSDISQESVDKAYRQLLTKGIRASGATKMRAVLTPLRAIMEHAAVRRWCDRPAFEAPAIAKSRTTFLRPDEATALVSAAADHIRPLLVFLIGTGVRMSEALELEWRDVDLRGARAIVWQKQGNERHVDLPPVVIASLSRLPNKTGRVFRPVRSRRPVGAAKGKTIGDGYMDTGRTGGGQIKSAWSTACRKANLPGTWRVWTPVGQKSERRFFVPQVTPHDLRHTWASAHYCMHKDLLRLKREGGWGTIQMVERYTHLMPTAYAGEWRTWLQGGPMLENKEIA